MAEWIRLTCQHCGESVLRVDVNVAMLWAQRHLARSHPGKDGWFASEISADQAAPQPAEAP